MFVESFPIRAPPPQQLTVLLLLLTVPPDTVQLLHKLKIRSSEGSDVLLKIIKNPITQYLPVNSIKLGTSVTGTLVDVRELANALPNDRDIVMTVGAHASGPADADWTDRSIAVSQYPLSASYAIGRVLNAFEYQWGCL